MKNILLQLSFLVSLLLIIGCEGGFDDPIDSKREIAIPLFYSTTNLTNLLDGINDETSITMGPDGIVTLNYRGNVTKRTGNELFGFIPPLPVPLTDDTTILPFDLPGTLDITLTKIKGGTFNIFFDNPFAEKVDVTLRVPELTKNGVVFEEQRLMDSVGTPGSQWLFFVPLKDYDLTTNDDQITIIYEAYRESDGERIVFPNDHGVGILDLEFSYAEGYWGQELLDLERDTIEIEFFENWVQGDVYFEDPIIQITVENGFGFPVQSIVNTLEILTVDGSNITLESSFIQDGINFAYPSLDEVGQIKTTIFDFDKTNSNVVEVLSSGPVSVDYDVDAISNPGSTEVIGFMTDSSYFQVQVAVDLPFRGHVNNFKGRDTFNVNFDQYDEVEYVEFKMVAENEIPLGIGVQVYFVGEDAMGNEILLDSLYATDENILTPAPVDSNGNATGEVAKKETYSTIDATQFENIRNAKKMIIDGTFFTTDVNNSPSPIVNLTTGQDVNIRMGMKVGTK
ncbi:MAG: hypothetical protein ACJAT4_001666 [Granulosicoccus sp.]|jgi:hypothetical protein